MKTLRYWLSPGFWLVLVGLRRPRPAARAPQAGARASQGGRRKWGKTTVTFYAVSSVCHVGFVGMLLSLPLGLRTHKRIHEPPIQAEENEVVENPHFNVPPPPKRALATPNSDPSSRADASSLAHAPATDDPDAEEAYKPAEPKRAGEPAVPVDIDTVAATKAAEKGIAAALDWFVRHQEPDGHWSLTEFGKHCQGDACAQPGAAASDAAATGLALLPFFGAGQTQTTSGPHAGAIERGLRWLIEHQHPSGDLSADAEGRMYPHAIATLALCENFALTRDRQVGAAAQLAVGFIVKSQNKATGGWHYEPGGLGNTSIVAWQMLALASAGRSGLKVDPTSLSHVDRWLRSVADGQQGGLYCYEPGRPVTATMTAIGVLCRQFQGTQPGSPAMIEGRDYLLEHLPASPFSQDIFYWYFGSPAMRNFGGADWQVWFHALRRILMETQCQQGCAAGSWGLDPPAPEAWSSRGGRLMVTSFAVQLLELEYGQLPLYSPIPNSPIPLEPVRAAAQDGPPKR